MEHPCDLAERIGDLLIDDKTSDMTFIVDGEYLPAHRRNEQTEHPENGAEHDFARKINIVLCESEVPRSTCISRSETLLAESSGRRYN